MEFDEILKLASENQGVAEKELVYKKGISTNVGKAKKQPRDRPKGVPSAGIQAFLKKKEVEEKRRAEEAKKKKENLMKLREEKNTVGKMRNIIKRNHTKEAIFEVEGKEERKNEDTPVLTPSKTDDKITEYTKLKSQTGTKVRVAAVQNVKRVKVSANWVPKEEREAQESAKHSTDEKPSSTTSSNSSSSKSKHSSKDSKINRFDIERERQLEEEKAKKEQEMKKKKKRPPAPPPMNFNDLLKLAEQKKSGVTEPEKKVDNTKKKDKMKKEPKLPDRPMTQEEKERWMRVHSKEYQAWIKHGKARPDFCVKERKKKRRSQGGTGSGSLNIKSAATVNDSDSEDSYSGDEDESDNNKTVNTQNKNVPSKSRDLSNTKSNGKSQQSGSFSKEAMKGHIKRQGNSSSSGGSSTKPTPVPKTLNLKPDKSLVSNDTRNNNKNASGKNSQNRPQVPSSKNNSSHIVSSSKKPSSSTNQISSKSGKVKNGQKGYDEVNENVLVCGKSSSSSNDNIKHERIRPQKEEPQISTWDKIYGQFQKKKKPKEEKKKKRVIESDSEVDSEMDDFIVSEEDEYDDMDDFIDDTDAMDYSKHIRAIFGYDKNKYSHIDEDDVDDMEAGFEDVEKEEMISEQIGIKEDLEDMRMEELHKKRKMAMKKKMAKKMRS